MRHRRSFCGDNAAASAFAALLSILCVQAAFSKDDLAFTDSGYDESNARVKCEDRRATGGGGQCRAQSSAAVLLERPLFAVVSIADQTVSIYNHQGLVTRSAVSTGMAGHPTPKGLFTIIGRERLHASNIYS